MASAAALAAVAVFAAPVAKADVVETFNLSGNFGSLVGSPVAYTGAIKLDFSNDFSSYTVPSISITLHGRSVFSQGVYLSVLPSVSVVGASNKAGDTLALWFAAPPSGSWAGFNTGDVSFGYVVFAGAGGLIGANGVVQRDLSDPAILDPPVLDPPVIDPPPLSDPPPITSGAVPELSTWAMMLLGLAGLGIAAKRRQVIGFLGAKA